MQSTLFELPASPEPDLWSFDWIVASISGGKDSQALLDLIVELADRAGVRHRLVAVHADLGEMEWEGVAALAAEHAAHYGIPFYLVSRTVEGESQSLLEQVEERGMWPDAARRYCTSDHKRGPIGRFITWLVNQTRAERGRDYRVRVLHVMGMRAQESPARAHRDPLRDDERNSSGTRYVLEWLILHRWTTEEVWERIAQAGTRIHPAYLAGMPRLSCVFCVLSSKSALVLAAQLNPELAERYAAVERRIGHRFRANLSMAQIIEEARQRPGSRLSRGGQDEEAAR
ncbi:phosphoadenosine phosphosulfate reductase family protein [Streptosporangium lutulentum]